jgi:hypothetical protein
MATAPTISPTPATVCVVSGSARNTAPQPHGNRDADSEVGGAQMRVNGAQGQRQTGRGGGDGVHGESRDRAMAVYRPMSQRQETTVNAIRSRVPRGIVGRSGPGCQRRPDDPGSLDLC